ncbi:-heptose -bisphosphate phosphatase : D,D-heptose 1,7-bisphosphate phosphatase OS=Geobacter metallireducens (strain GS-15 / ATCC 53774 / DSM 7210) GN=gmhB PE=3 SV=1: Hydrolase_6: Hydrolase_like [Gemmata massiliana]|uniref:D,D-heptose 1,7-bisphosphate phosphatase n=1 Tax=Gemmata massiliana TaxID=1210884 RepID=A0A6P2D136_9BACT|nr:HAD family hydrolase [Gemmata massiliana]VTR93122.1 -heptose -bisphosphate phosphatase : D,D-heptose 1,7-bisphosphate phosphatase OS=Geobacter metallireducens (strain GS-15 / ATCC 53774 / DSM 7210) GN=gmhB PE=3 SV=1: Hydrolase_6: Hydrolase_like [Gemmata massiliana]
MSREAVFLDRDGTLIEEVNHLSSPDQVRLIPGAAEAVRRLNDAGVLVIVITNQSGVARGYFPESRLSAVHDRVSELLAAHGAKVDAYYYCPHHPTEGIGAYRVTCTCRKPKPGMLLTAARDFDIDLARSWMVGDKVCDSGAGDAAGCRSVLVRTGHGRELPNAVADLTAAIELWAASR